MFITWGTPSILGVAQVMLFSIKPKERRDELYDFEKELEELMKGIERSPITIVIGMRRTGKTSLLKVALNELGNPYIYLDTRFSVNPTYRDFIYIVKESLEDFVRRYKSFREKIVEVLSSVKGVSISIPFSSIDISWRGSSKLEFPEFFTALNRIGSELKKSVVVAFDEAQELRKITWINFVRLFAYIYDNLDYVRIVLTGSEVGLLYKFLRLDDRDSPLYGRYIHTVSTRRLTFEESIDFLEKGFKEIGISVNKQVIEEVAKTFGGVIGWLTLFGYNCYMNPDLCSHQVDKVLKIAIDIAKNEIENFLSSRRSVRYKTLLKILTVERSWSEIKKKLEDIEGRTINDKTLNELLNTLIDLSIIEKKDNKYIVADPITRKAVEEL
ncbi:MAG: ATP-binding protein [Desulfurococcaceae archaeon]|nr:ATP-binding protein [Desulfurococcaceae archaeon]